MKSFRLASLLLLCLVSANLRAQVADSLRQYVMECVDIMQNQSLYSSKLNWKKIRNSVEQKLSRGSGAPDAEAAVIWVFQQLKDHHGMYGGIDTSYRYTKPGPERKMSTSILAEYKKPRAVKTAMLSNGIAYYKMPAVLIGSDTTKMRQWANVLTDSLCKLEVQQPRAYIIDLRMNNGGNQEPMWQALKNLIGEENRTYYANARRKVLPEATDSATIRYKSAAIPNNPCTFRKNIPLAVLIGPGTASSGEITALSFTTRTNTKLFGEPTIGVANVTNGFVIMNKGYLLLTVGYIANARKKVLSNYFIQPDIMVNSDGDNYMELEKDETIQAAISWLNSKVKIKK